MSIIRDTMEAGYSSDHFMITGEGFPKSWKDEDEEDPVLISYRKAIADENKLATEEQWLQEGRFISQSEYSREYRHCESAGVMNGKLYYRKKDTRTIEGRFEEMQKVIKYVFEDTLVSESKLDKSMAVDRALNVAISSFKELVSSEIDDLCQDILDLYTLKNKKEEGSKPLFSKDSDADIPF